MLFKFPPILPSSSPYSHNSHESHDCLLIGSGESKKILPTCPVLPRFPDRSASPLSFPFRHKTQSNLDTTSCETCELRDISTTLLIRPVPNPIVLTIPRPWLTFPIPSNYPTLIPIPFQRRAWDSPSLSGPHLVRELYIIQFFCCRPVIF